MSKYVSSEYGQIRIYKNVIARIAEEAAREVSGVLFAGSDCFSIWGKLFFVCGVQKTKITHSVEAKNELKIIIPIIVQCGKNLGDVAYEVQKQVISHMLVDLNIDALSVDVRIVGIKRG